MKPIIPDTTTNARMAGLERFLQRYLGPRQPEFGTLEEDLRSIEMPAPLLRFFKFAGRWPGHNPRTPYANRFCMQDQLLGIRKKDYALALELMDDRLIFVWENQGVWVAATERVGADPPVWISENCSHRDPVREWRQLEKPLSHFLVSFVLQELMFGSEILAVASGALAKFEEAKVRTEPVWINGNTRGTSIDHRTIWPANISWFAVPRMKLMATTGMVAILSKERNCWNRWGCRRRFGEKGVFAVSVCGASAEPADEADRGRRPGFARHEGHAGGPGSLSLTFGLMKRNSPCYEIVRSRLRWLSSSSLDVPQTSQRRGKKPRRKFQWSRTRRPCPTQAFKSPKPPRHKLQRFPASPPARRYDSLLRRKAAPE